MKNIIAKNNDFRRFWIELNNYLLDNTQEMRNLSFTSMYYDMFSNFRKIMFFLNSNDITENVFYELNCNNDGLFVNVYVCDYVTFTFGLCDTEIYIKFNVDSREIAKIGKIGGVDFSDFR